jgi:penicillin-binding protein-related factor A (putative recombinase)
MFSKIIISFVLLCFILFQWACMGYSVRTESAETIAQNQEQSVKIISILKKSGEQIDFPNGAECSIQNQNLIVPPGTLQRTTNEKDQLNESIEVRWFPETAERIKIIRQFIETYDGIQNKTSQSSDSSSG